MRRKKIDPVTSLTIPHKIREGEDIPLIHEGNRTSFEYDGNIYTLEQTDKEQKISIKYKEGFELIIDRGPNPFPVGAKDTGPTWIRIQQPDDLLALFRDWYEGYKKQHRRTPPLIKAGIHLERQKFGKKPKEQLQLFDGLETDDRGAVVEKPTIIGIDPTIAQNKAIFAVQKLLSGTNYEGDLPPVPIPPTNVFKFTGNLPRLKITVNEYLDAFGVGKNESARGWMEYNRNERDEALKALRDLTDNRYLFFYERRYWTDKGEERFDVIKTIRPLISIVEGYEALTRPERDSIVRGEDTDSATDKLKHLVIEPSPIFVDQIDSYFVLKPANYHQEIKMLVPHASKYVYTFIDYLLTETESRRRHNKGWTIKINWKDLAYKLRMEAWIRSRNWKQIRVSLNKCYDTAKDLGYLSSYETTPGVTKEIEVFHLNEEKFNKMWNLQERKKQTPEGDG